MEVDQPIDANSKEESHWHKLAQKHWQKKSSKKPRVKVDVVQKEIWDVLEKDHFDYQSLVTLETLELLERYLWPGYDEDSTNQHVLLISLLVTIKARQSLPTWEHFANDPERFSSLFRRVLSLMVDPSLQDHARTLLLAFLIHAFQCLDSNLIRKECAPLVSISIWHNLGSEAIREHHLDSRKNLRKAWRASNKRFDAADGAGKARLLFERAWLYSLVLDFFGRLQSSNEGDLSYCERFLELLTDLLSQLPTRRYVRTLLLDLNILAIIPLSPSYKRTNNGLLRDLYALLRQFVNFQVDDHTGAQYSTDEQRDIHFKKLAQLQRISLKHFREKLTILALSNYGSIDKREELRGFLDKLTGDELDELLAHVNLRSKYPASSKLTWNRELAIEVLIVHHERRKSFKESVGGMAILPTETSLYEESLLRNEHYDGSRPVAIPKLNLQYLTVGDFLWRSFILYRCEQYFEIRKHLEDTVRRLRPAISGPRDPVVFQGSSKMALPISKPAILESAAPLIGTDYPSYVRAEITLNVGRLTDAMRQDWESLRPEDTVFLVSVQSRNEAEPILNGQKDDALSAFALNHVRAAEVVRILDENGRPVREDAHPQMNGHPRRPRVRRLIVDLDPIAFERDSKTKENQTHNVYESMNVLIRRNRRENNFKKTLETIRTLTVSDAVAPEWLQDVFLGFGDPKSATYTSLSNRLPVMNMQDTFVDWQHLVDGMEGRDVVPEQGLEPEFAPPYVLEEISAEDEHQTRPQKRRRGENDADISAAVTSPNAVRVSSVQRQSNGPYPADAPKVNQIRFTPRQVDAIASGTQPGLTIIVGPPGTGKTDVATQIISNIYHNFPEQRTLLIAHSNQALNQLFQKIINLDIDGRHLLRLGQGEAELEADQSYSKYGRVESFLENRALYLAEVNRLAANFAAPGAHGNSCETAGYFDIVYVQPAWQQFFAHADDDSVSSADLIEAFPFHSYFANAPQPLFPPDASKDSVVDIAKGCARHIKKIFDELADIRPFEIIRSNRDKTNYLMVKEARIIAMTATHASMRRQEIAELGFHYDNVVLEEAAQITEVENFIPIVLQNSKNGASPLQRVVLCGDHLQNSPIVQSMAFRQYAKLEQSLFLRMMRLGVPAINLDAQGRARSSIAELYKWRYPDLKNLPKTLSEAEFLTANAGFRYDYQFIDVQSYKGKGETQPSPHFIQNLGEAEYAVAIYQYMRLLGYPARKISILTPYAGQRALIRDVLSHRCARNRLFGMPRIVTTVDKYQGEQNDYIILSLVRTSRPGYLRDLRRLTVALSRARLGLYVLGRRSVFETSAEISQAFDLLFKRPAQLMLTTGEMFPTKRLLDAEDVPATEMTGVEHLGQYVFEMTQAKVKMLQEGNAQLPPQESQQHLDIDGDEDEVRDSNEEGSEGDGEQADDQSETGPDPMETESKVQDT